MLCDIQLNTTYSLWFTPLCLLLGGFFSFLAYYKNSTFREVPRNRLALLAFLRFASVSLLAFLLLQPVLTTLERTLEKPVILIAQDVSSSLSLNNDSNVLQNHENKVRALADRLKTTYEVRSYAFADGLLDNHTSGYTEKQTNIARFLDEIQNRYTNRNVGALILLSDGLFNKGSNPVYKPYNFDFPIYTIALGDTTGKKDLAIENIKHNNIAYLGNQFPVVVDVFASDIDEGQTLVRILQNGKILVEQPIMINPGTPRLQVKFNLEANQPGVQRYQVEILPLENEKNKANNYRDLFIEVLDGRQRILLLAHSPHPDVGAIKSSLSGFDNYQVDLALEKKISGNLETYDLIILHQMPSGNQSSNLMKQIKDSGIPLLFILGEQTSISEFNQLDAGLRIEQSINNPNASKAIFQDRFSLFVLSETLLLQVAEFPPLSSPFGEYIQTGEFQSLFNQRIGLIDSKKPLISFSKREGRKTGFVAGSGLWRWRLRNFQRSKNHESFDQLIVKTVQYLSLKDDKSRFRVKGKNQYMENEPIRFDAELYNQSYELINDREVEMRILDDENKEYTYVFNRNSSAYTLNAGTLPIGNYQYEASVKASNGKLSKTGVFTVLPLLVESIHTKPDHALLARLSQKYNGSMNYPENMDQLDSLIAGHEDILPVTYEEKKPLDLIHLKWIFFLILALLSTEWFIRKRNGAY